MTTQLTVAASPSANAAGDVAQVVAALPASLHPAAHGADLVAVDGSPGWPDAARQAIESGARGVLVVRPGPADVAALLELANARNTPVVLDATWTYNPAVQNSSGPFAELSSDRVLLEARVYVPSGSDWDRVLLDQLSLIRAAVSPVVRLSFARRSGNGYAALGELSNGARANITAIHTDSVNPAAALRIITPERMVELEVPSPRTAVPGKVHVSGPDGSTLLETKWETAHRAAWRHLHGLAVAGLTSSDLADFNDDQAVAAV